MGSTEDEVAGEGVEVVEQIVERVEQKMGRVEEKMGRVEEDIKLVLVCHSILSIGIFLLACLHFPRSQQSILKRYITEQNMPTDQRRD